MVQLKGMLACGQVEGAGRVCLRVSESVPQLRPCDRKLRCIIVCNGMGGRLAQIEGDKPAKKKFKSYPIRFFHIEIELPVWRRETADYLELSIETVARSISQLQGRRADDRPTAAAAP